MPMRVLLPLFLQPVTETGPRLRPCLAGGQAGAGILAPTAERDGRLPTTRAVAAGCGLLRAV